MTAFKVGDIVIGNKTEMTVVKIMDNGEVETKWIAANDKPQSDKFPSEALKLKSEVLAKTREVFVDWNK